MKARLIAILTVILISCSRNSEELKPVQQQQAGDYKITILSETGSLKHGANKFTLEFRKTTDNALTDVGTVDVAPVMEMAGMGPMMAEAEVTPSSTPGRYEAKGNLTMSGLWKITIKFGDGQSARFNVSAE